MRTFVATASAALCLTGALAIAAPTAQATPSVDLSSDARDILPEWAKHMVDANGETIAPAVGEREVWLKPILLEGSPHLDSQQLIEGANSALSVFERDSNGALTVTATKVLPTMTYTVEPGEDPCDATVEPRVAAWREHQPPPGVHVVLLFTEAAGCFFAGLGHTPGQWVELFDLNEDGTSLATSSALVHEIGHNLGLPHANAFKGFYWTDSSSPSRFTEVMQYVDNSSVMGLAALDRSVAFSVFDRASMGWETDVVSIPTDTSDTTVKLAHLALPGTDAAVVTDPATGDRYSFTYTDTRADNAGVVIHKITDQKAPDPFGQPENFLDGYVAFANRIAYREYMEGMKQADIWLSPSKTLRVEVLDMTSASVTLRVQSQPDGVEPMGPAPVWKFDDQLVTVDQRRDLARVLILPAASPAGIVKYRVRVKGATLVEKPKQSVAPGVLRTALISLGTKRKVTVHVIATARDGQQVRWKHVIDRRKTRR